MDDKTSTTGFSCRLCGSERAHTPHVAREMMFGSRESFDYFQCNGCGCLQIAEIPPDLSRYYPSNYYSHSAQDDIRRRSWLRRVLETRRAYTALFGRGYRLSRLIKPFVPLPHEIHKIPGEVVHRAGLKDFGAAILDVGSGSSAVWLRHMELLGFKNLTAVDPFADCDRKLGAVRVLRKEVSALQGQYDLIRLSHSLEHIPDQHRTFADLRRLLAPGGTI
ncbi:MAG TPA: class I SAM-dependent methyltransferase, partial [Gammaproteobacteria bacterium]|nr:class I SAM-dependent methyltransferase [Gammaproteobacteria bacterium]